jgi:hypothetical protein
MITLNCNLPDKKLLIQAISSRLGIPVTQICFKNPMEEMFIRDKIRDANHTIGMVLGWLKSVKNHPEKWTGVAEAPCSPDHYKEQFSKVLSMKLRKVRNLYARLREVS